MAKLRQGVVLLLAVGMFAGQMLASPPGPQMGADPRPDYTSARREIQAFESALNDVITETFNKAPFAVYQKAKGAYLQGYGMAFSFMVNIHVAMINTPFGKYQRPDASPEQKRRQIEMLKERLILVLLQRGDVLNQMPRSETVSIIGYFEDRNFPDEESQNKTVILSLIRKDLDEFVHKEDRLKEFKQRMKIIEY
jgi:hypothetical protein